MATDGYENSALHTYINRAFWELHGSELCSNLRDDEIKNSKMVILPSGCDFRLSPNPMQYRIPTLRISTLLYFYNRQQHKKNR